MTVMHIQINCCCFGFFYLKGLSYDVDKSIFYKQLVCFNHVKINSETSMITCMMRSRSECQHFYLGRYHLIIKRKKGRARIKFEERQDLNIRPPQKKWQDSKADIIKKKILSKKNLPEIEVKQSRIHISWKKIFRIK